MSHVNLKTSTLTLGLGPELSYKIFMVFTTTWLPAHHHMAAFTFYTNFFLAFKGSREVSIKMIQTE